MSDLKFVSIPVPATARTVESKYDFHTLVVNGPALAVTDILNVDKAKSRMNSALVAYRQRTGDKSKFTIRPFKNEDGTDAVGCWKIAEAPAVAVAASAVEAPAADEGTAD